MSSIWFLGQSSQLRMRVYALKVSMVPKNQLNIDGYILNYKRYLI